MRAKFYSDIDLENFVDEAAALHEVDVVTNPGNREVNMRDCGHIFVELTALVQINGGEVIFEAGE